MRLLHLQRHMLPQEVDMLRISVETLDGLHGRLRVVSPKLLPFDLHLTAKVDRRPSSPSPASPSRSMSAHKSKAAVRQLCMLQRALEKERRRSSELLEDIHRYQEQGLQRCIHEGDPASGSEGEASPTSKRGGRHHSTSDASIGYSGTEGPSGPPTATAQARFRCPFPQPTSPHQPHQNPGATKVRRRTCGPCALL
eukprot:EG_transcript_14810